MGKMWPLAMWFNVAPYSWANPCICVCIYIYTHITPRQTCQTEVHYAPHFSYGKTITTEHGKTRYGFIVTIWRSKVEPLLRSGRPLKKYAGQLGLLIFPGRSAASTRCWAELIWKTHHGFLDGNEIVFDLLSFICYSPSESIEWCSWNEITNWNTHYKIIPCKVVQDLLHQK